MTTTPESVVILGGVSRVARYMALDFAQRGWAVVLADPDVTELETIATDLRVRCETPCHVLAFDATSPEDHEGFMARCVEALGAMPSGVVVCFGFMPAQEQAQADFTVTRRVIDINFAGAVSILEHFAAVFEARGSGFIAGLSSPAGDRGRKMNYIYGAAKAGLSIYLQGLRNRLYSSGVTVTTIKPGFMDTAMTYGMNLPALLVTTPEKAAHLMVQALIKKRDIAYIPFYWRYILLIIKSIPEWQFKKMSI